VALLKTFDLWWFQARYFFHLPGISFQGQNTHRTVTNTKYDVSKKVKQLKTGSKHGVHPKFPSVE